MLAAVWRIFVFLLNCIMTTRPITAANSPTIWNQNDAIGEPRHILCSSQIDFVTVTGSYSHTWLIYATLYWPNTTVTGGIRCTFPHEYTSVGPGYITYICRHEWYCFSTLVRQVIIFFFLIKYRVYFLISRDLIYIICYAFTYNICIYICRFYKIFEETHITQGRKSMKGLLYIYHILLERVLVVV